MWHEQLDVVPRRIPVVAVAAGLAEHDDRDLKARAGDRPVGDRLLDPEVGAAGIAHGRDPDREGLAEVLLGDVELARERLLGVAPQVDVR